MERVRSTALDCGVSVVTEELPELRSVAVGFWSGTGSRDEPDGLFGASHFLEHLLFKGTPSRSATDIAEAVESVGGDMNAFTTKEYTAYYVRVLDEHLELALDILSDVVWSPSFRAEEVESERQVILEEIRMHEDSPDELAHSLFSEVIFPGHPLGREILGDVSMIEAMERDAIAAFHEEHYQSANLVVAAAGHLEHERVAEAVADRFAGRNGNRPPRGLGEQRSQTGTRVLTRPTEQAHVVLGVPSVPRGDPDRYALSVLNQVLGGGMSSRLFQEIRERRGLAYSVYSFRQAFEDGGLFAVYVGTAPARAKEVIGLVHAELDRLVAERRVTGAELDRAKGHLKGELALSLEGSASRMERLGRSQLTFAEIPSLDEVVGRIDRVTPDDVAQVIDRVLTSAPRSLAVVGPFDASDFDASDLDAAYIDAAHMDGRELDGNSETAG